MLTHKVHLHIVNKSTIFSELNVPITKIIPLTENYIIPDKKRTRECKIAGRNLFHKKI